MSTSGQYFSDGYFEQLLSESELLLQQPPPPPPMTMQLQPPMLQSHLYHQHRHQHQPQQYTESHRSAFTAYAGPTPQQQQQQQEEDQQQQHRPKRHQRPAHKEAELRRLCKIRDGIQQLMVRCRVVGVGQQVDRRHRNAVSESATLRECHRRMLAAELAVTAQRQEIDQLRRRLADSAMPSGQAIDYVQTKWLESPRFELFYKLVGKSITDAFVGHMQAASTTVAASAVPDVTSSPSSTEPSSSSSSRQTGRPTTVEDFPAKWLARISQDDIRRRSVRYFDRQRHS